MMLESLFGSLFGGLFRLAPEIIKWLDKKDERAHELKMFTLQTDLEKVKGTFKMEEKYAEYSTEQLKAIGEAFKEQSSTAQASYKWVAAVSALVRPGITWALFGLYCAVKIATLSMAINAGGAWQEVIVKSWVVEDWAMLNGIITYWFLDRTVAKYGR